MRLEKFNLPSTAKRSKVGLCASSWSWGVGGNAGVDGLRVGVRWARTRCGVASGCAGTGFASELAVNF